VSRITHVMRSRAGAHASFAAVATAARPPAEASAGAASTSSCTVELTRQHSSSAFAAVSTAPPLHETQSHLSFGTSHRSAGASQVSLCAGTKQDSGSHAGCVAPDHGNSMRQEVGQQAGQVVSGQLLQLYVADSTVTNGRAAELSAM